MREQIVDTKIVPVSAAHDRIEQDDVMEGPNLCRFSGAFMERRLELQ